MSRNVIVGLAVLVVAALSWIVIDRLAEGDVAQQGDGTAVEVDEDALVAEEGEVAPTVATPEEDVQNLAKNNDDDPLEQQTENAAGNDEELSEEAEMAPDAETAETAEGETEALETVEDIETGTAAALTEEGNAEAAEADAAETDTVEDGTVEDGTVELETVEVEEVEVEATEGAAPEASTDDAATMEVTTDDATGDVATEGPVTEGAEQTATETDGSDSEEPRVSTDVTEGGAVETDSSVSADAPAADTPADAEGGLAALLTPETFDVDAIRTYVETSEELDPVGRAALMTALDQAEENPEFVDAAILSLKRRFEIE